MRFNNFKKSGFSLVEVLVAISILLIVIVGPMTMITRSNNATSFASEQVNAWFLAQEGLELVEKQRDDFLLQSFRTTPAPISDPWARFTSSSGVLADCFEATGCGLFITNNATPTVTPSDCSVITACRLYLSTSGRSKYTHTSSGNSPTPYTRVIKIEETTPNNEVKVTSTVTWRTGSLIAGQKVEAVTYLLNVYGKP